MFLFSAVRCFETFFLLFGHKPLTLHWNKKNLNECRWPENHRIVDVGKWKIKPELLETHNRKGSFQNGMAYVKISSSITAVFKCPLKNYVSPKIMASLTNKNLQNISFCQETNFPDGRNKRGSLWSPLLVSTRQATLLVVQHSEIIYALSGQNAHNPV